MLGTRLCRCARVAWPQRASDTATSGVISVDSPLRPHAQASPSGRVGARLLRVQRRPGAQAHFNPKTDAQRLAHAPPSRSAVSRPRLGPDWSASRPVAGASRVATSVIGPTWLVAGRSHIDTRVGCIVWSTTPSSSFESVSRSMCSRSRALNASTVLAAL
jgi:hypothetical protein